MKVTVEIKNNETEMLLTALTMSQKKAGTILGDLMEEYHFNKDAESMTEFDWKYNQFKHNTISMKLQIVFDYLCRMENGLNKLETALNELELLALPAADLEDEQPGAGDDPAA